MQKTNRNYVVKSDTLGFNMWIMVRRWPGHYRVVNNPLIKVAHLIVTLCKYERILISYSKVFADTDNR